MVEYITEGIEGMKLSEGVKGKTYITDGVADGMRASRRLLMLGITRGTPLYVLNKKRRGAMIIKFRGTRFALGRGIYRKSELRKNHAF